MWPIAAQPGNSQSYPVGRSNAGLLAAWSVKGSHDVGNTKIVSTTDYLAHQCYWQFGGPTIPGTLNNFGGTSAAEYGDLYPLVFAGPHGPTIEKLNYRQVIGNPCKVINP